MIIWRWVIFNQSNLKYMLIISRSTFSRSTVCLMNLASWLGSCCRVTGSTCARLPDHVCMLVVLSPGESESFLSASFTPLRRHFMCLRAGRCSHVSQICWAAPYVVNTQTETSESRFLLTFPPVWKWFLRIDSVSSPYQSGHRTFLHGWFLSQERPGLLHNGETLEHSQMSEILK